MKIGETIKTTDASLVASYKIRSDGLSDNPDYADSEFVTLEHNPLRTISLITGKESWTPKQWDITRLRKGDCLGLEPNVPQILTSDKIHLLQLRQLGHSVPSSRVTLSGIRFSVSARKDSPTYEVTMLISPPSSSSSSPSSSSGSEERKIAV